MTRLYVELLEVIRLEIGPLHVSSGFRTPELSRAIGGPPTTCHVYGGGGRGAPPHRVDAAAGHGVIARSHASASSRCSIR